jgi:hypothetical protein
MGTFIFSEKSCPKFYFLQILTQGRKGLPEPPYFFFPATARIIR